MIRFTLKCHDDHRFDSWFQSADAFDRLLGAGMVTCAVCGSASVTKAMMAPQVRTSRDEAPAPTESQVVPAPDATPPALGTPATETEQALAKLRHEVETKSDYVGTNFAREARDIHDGLAPERPIYGEARIDEAKKLIKDGVPVMPLPFVPARKTN